MNLNAQTMFDKIANTAASEPNKVAIVYDDTKIVYSDLFNRVNSLARTLILRGIQKEDKISVLTNNKVDFLIGITASMSIGAIPVPHNGIENLKWIIADCESKAIVCDFSFEKEIEILLEEDKKVILINFHSNYRTHSTFIRRPDILLQDIAMMFYTSGTTSRTRTGVLLSHNNLIVTAKYMNNSMKIQSDIVEYVIAPINHAFGFGRCRAVIYAGGTLVLNEGVFNPAKTIMAIEKYDCNGLSSVSSGFAILIEHYEKHFKTVGSRIKWVEIGSLPLSVYYKKRLLKILPVAKIYMNYGLTEAMRSTLIEMRSESHKIETVGRPSPGLEINITNENGKSLKSGETGEISIRGDNVGKGYWKKRGLWHTRYRDGWFRTGDIGYLDRDGYLIFIGRKDDIINIGGEKFSPFEVEEKLRPLLKGKSYCVSGAPDNNGILGEVPVLCVEQDFLFSIEDIKKYLNGIIEEYKIPRLLYHFERLPKTENGKIKHGEIRKQILEGKKYECF